MVGRPPRPRPRFSNKQQARRRRHIVVVVRLPVIVAAGAVAAVEMNGSKCASAFHRDVEIDDRIQGN